MRTRRSNAADKTRWWTLICIGSFGDVLLATGLARALRRALRSSDRVRFFVGSRYAEVVAGNPDLDDIVVVPCKGKGGIEAAREVAHEAAAGTDGPVIDLHLEWAEDARSRVGQAQGMVQIAQRQGAPVDRLDAPRITADDAAAGALLEGDDDDRPPAILFEYACESYQSVIGQRPSLASQFLGELMAQGPGDARWLLSASPEQPLVAAPSSRIFDARSLNFPQTAALLGRVRGFVGVGSGITVLSCSDAVVRRNPGLRRVVIGKPGDLRGDIGPQGSHLVPEDRYLFLEGPDLQTMVRNAAHTLFSDLGA